MDIKARKNLCDVLALLTNRFPFYSFFAFGWKLIETSGLKTFATDIENLYYDPEVLHKWNKETTLFALLHEVVHCIYLHPGTFGVLRLGSKDQAVWNMACEYVVNSETKEILQLSERELPQNIYYDSQYTGKTTEQVYEILKKKKHNFTWLKIAINQSNIESSCGNCGRKLNEGDFKSGKCRGCGKELPDRNHGFIDVHLPQEVREKVQQAVERILAGYEICKNKGTLPAGIERQIGELKQAQVPWERVLHRLVGQVVTQDDYRWETPNHRHPLSEEFIIPGLRSEKVGEIVVAIDTSGSIGQQEMDSFAGEMKKLHSLVEEILVLTCDCSLYEKVKTRNIQEFLSKLKMKGGGGTSFIPVFDELKKTKCTPSILIYFTDGYGNFPEVSPKRYPVLWVLTENHQDPPWGRTTVIRVGGE
jgi:predicted metal-dependent peptidase